MVIRHVEQLVWGVVSTFGSTSASIIHWTGTHES
jgi:hypothetical protein